jgi:hypothetical protein
MMRRRFLFFLTLGSLVIWPSSPTLAQSFDDESQFGYDYIVRELSRGETSTTIGKYSDPFSQVKIHLGVSFLSSHISIDPIDRKSYSGFHRGFEANFGIDLFTPEWTAEGVVRTFSPQNVGRESIGLKEFELRVVRRYRIAPSLTWRLGGGLTARYLDVSYTRNGQASSASGAAAAEASSATPSPLVTVSERYTTPASVITTGMELRLTEVLGLGLELSFRSSMIDETIDKQSVDAALRVAGQF